MTSLTTASDGASGGMSKLTLNESGSTENSRLTENSSKSGHGGEGGPVSPRTLDVIDEDRTSGDETSPSSSSSQQQQQQHRSKRANMVKKALTYFSDKSNRSVSEDNLFTRYTQLWAANDHLSTTTTTFLSLFSILITKCYHWTPVTIGPKLWVLRMFVMPMCTQSYAQSVSGIETNKARPIDLLVLEYHI